MTVYLNHDKCVRIDNGDGTETDCDIQRAYDAIETCYVNPQPVLAMLHNGQEVHCTFAAYKMVRATA